MKVDYTALGFSLVEVLVALFVISLTAVNISALQKIVADQTRNNTSYVTVLSLAKDRIEEVKQIDDMQKMIDLNGTTSTLTKKGVLFTLTWNIEMLTGASLTSPIRDVAVKIVWSDAKGRKQIFSYSEQVSLQFLLKGAGGSEKIFPYVVPNLLNTNQVNYFESNMDYKKEAYVIYDSQLFQATKDHSLGNVQQDDILAPINKDGSIASGWDNFGRIDNTDLAALFID